MKRWLLSSVLGALAFLGVFLGTMTWAEWSYQQQDFATAYTLNKGLAYLGIDCYRTRLGTMHIKGQGVPQSYSEAIAWYRGPAENGDARSQHLIALAHMGLAHSEGAGQQHPAELDRITFDWFLRAANKNYKLAQEMVAVRYLAGDGVEANAIEALKWLHIVGGGNLPEASLKELQTDFSLAVTPQELTEAKALADAWLAKHQDAR